MGVDNMPPAWREEAVTVKCYFKNRAQHNGKNKVPMSKKTRHSLSFTKSFVHTLHRVAFHHARLTGACVATATALLTPWP